MRFESALEIETRIHYHEVDRLSGPWDSIRLNRLASLLRISYQELAQLVRVSPGMMFKYMTRQRFPAPIRLLLDLLETSAYHKYLGRKPAFNIFPEI